MVRYFPLLVVFLCAAPPLPAQQARDSTRTDTAVIRLPPIDIVTSILRAPAGPRARSGLPARALTMDAAALQRWRPRLLTDALTMEPAASAYDDLGSPLKQTLVMRGFAASPVVGLPQGVTVLVDGIPLNEPGAGEVAFDLLPLESVERVEVLSGTASLLGPNSLGGAVNLVTRRGGDGAGDVELEAGSFGSRGVHARLHGAAASVDYYGAAGHERERGWREQMRGQRTHFLLSLARLNELRGARLLIFGAHSNAQTAGSLPLSVFRAQPDSNLTAGDFELLRQLNVAVAGYAPAAAGVVSLRLYARVGDAERFNVNQAADPDVRGFTDSRTLGVDTDWSTTRALARASVDLRIGAGGMLNRTAIALHTERIDPGLTTDVLSPIRRFDAYAIAAAHAGPATLTVGARFDAIRVPFHNRLRPERDTTSTFVQLSPRAGASLRIGSAVAHASAGMSFRPPALIEIACADPEEPCPLPFALGDDPPIRPVRVTTFEAGLSWARGGIGGQLSAYRSDVRDDIFLFPYADEDEPEGSTIDGYFGNVPRTRRIGVEALVEAVSRRGHRAFASYAHTRATFRTGGIEIFSIREAAGGENEVEPGSRFPLVPEHTLAAGVHAVLPYGFSAGAALRHVGEQYLRGDEANVEAPLQAYTTGDIRIGFERDHWQVDAVVRNVTDARHITFATFNINQGADDAVERFVTPGAPRRLEIGVRRAFQHRRLR